MDVTHNGMNLLPLEANTSVNRLTLLHSERPKLYTILAFLSATGLTFLSIFFFEQNMYIS